jgi:hypothetical protein
MKSVVKNPKKIVDDAKVLVEMEEKKVKSVTRSCRQLADIEIM